MSLKTSFAKVLRTIRSKRNISQRDFGDTSRTYLSKLEGARSSITLDKLDQVSQRLALSPLTLVTLTLCEETGHSAAEVIANTCAEIDALAREGGLPELQFAMSGTTLSARKPKPVPPQGLQAELCFSASQ